MAASGMLDLGAIAEMAATLPAVVNSLLKEVQALRTVTGMKGRAARLKALGNCNPPQMYGPFLRAIKIMEEATNGRGA